MTASTLWFFVTGWIAFLSNVNWTGIPESPMRNFRKKYRSATVTDVAVGKHENEHIMRSSSSSKGKKQIKEDCQTRGKPLQEIY